MKLLLVIIAVFSCICFVTKAELFMKKGVPNVNLNGGILQGRVNKARDERPFYAFYGIPYADPPKRFEAAKEFSEKWKGPKLAGKDQIGPRCPHADIFEAPSHFNEDCLNLNIYIPMRPPKSDKGHPVMVWIHDPILPLGEANVFDPSYIMEEDVILVTFNYRIGALGFLTTGDEELEANLGLKDQVLALKWIQKHISKFDGDKDKVTLCGHGMGSTFVHYHVLSPMSKGLFHRAIVQSRTATSPWALSSNPKFGLTKLATGLKCKTATTDMMIECIKGKNLTDVLRVERNLLLREPLGGTLFAPTVENKGKGRKFLPKHPLEILSNKKVNNVPLLIGGVKTEGYFTGNDMTLHTNIFRLNNNFQKQFPIMCNYDGKFNTDDLESVTEEIQEFYEIEPPVESHTKLNMVNLFTDMQFTHPVFMAATSHAQKGNDVYTYLITYKGESSLIKAIKGDNYTDDFEEMAPVTIDDLQYFTPDEVSDAQIKFPPFEKGSKHENFSKQIIKLWVSFAVHGEPLSTWGPENKWPPVSKAEYEGEKPLRFYQLDEKTGFMANPFQNGLKFWQDLYEKFPYVHAENTEKERRDEL